MPVFRVYSRLRRNSAAWLLPWWFLAFFKGFPSPGSAGSHMLSHFYATMRYDMDFGRRGLWKRRQSLRDNCKRYNGKKKISNFVQPSVAYFKSLVICVWKRLVDLIDRDWIAVKKHTSPLQEARIFVDMIWSLDMSVVIPFYNTVWYGTRPGNAIWIGNLAYTIRYGMIRPQSVRYLVKRIVSCVSSISGNRQIVAHCKRLLSVW